MKETRGSDHGTRTGTFEAVLGGTLAARRCGDWRRRLLATTALGSVLVMTPAAAWANPAGGVVVGGEAVIQHAPGVTTIDQATQRALINWKQFSIAPGELTQFRQPGTDAIALNRVVGNDASEIMGALNANGQVWLINPNGILFGPNARIDVHGILATTTDIADRDFMAGRYDFNQPSPNPAASVVNQGAISIGEKGLGALVAPHVRNDGVIAGKLGQVVLAGAETFTLDFYGDGLVQFAATSEMKEALEEQGAIVSNDGTISAEGGTVLITAAAASDVVDEVINVSGVVEAKSVAMKDGAIVLDGGGSGIVHVAGTLDASGSGTGEKGGTVKVLGEKVGLFDGARVDASGDAGGGEVLIGGNYQGKGLERNAERTVVFEKATVKADALKDGDGGRVIVWSDEGTRFEGTISARGGSEDGDGGFVEVSGRDNLVFQGKVDTSAEAGQAGTLLLDPSNITIGGSETNSITVTPGDPFVFSPNDNFAELPAETLVAQLQGGQNVVVSTSFAGSNTQDGDITVADTINAPDDSGNLTLQAENDIFVNAPIDFSGTPGSVTLGATGSVSVDANVTTSGGQIGIISEGGSGITITGATVDAQGGFIFLDAGTISVGGTVMGGTVSMAAFGSGDESENGPNAGAISVGGTVMGGTVILNALGSGDESENGPIDGGSISVDGTVMGGTVFLYALGSGGESENGPIDGGSISVDGTVMGGQSVALYADEFTFDGGEINTDGVSGVIEVSTDRPLAFVDSKDELATQTQLTQNDLVALTSPSVLFRGEGITFETPTDFTRFDQVSLFSGVYNTTANRDVTQTEGAVISAQRLDVWVSSFDAEQPGNILLPEPNQLSAAGGPGVFTAVPTSGTNIGAGEIAFANVGDIITGYSIGTDVYLTSLQGGITATGQITATTGEVNIVAREDIVIHAPISAVTGIAIWTTDGAFTNTQSITATAGPVGIAASGADFREFFPVLSEVGELSPALGTGGPITIGAPITSGSVDSEVDDRTSILIVTDASFINSAGPNALSPASRFLVYSIDPQRDQIGGLVGPEGIRFGLTFEEAPPAAIPGEASLVIYELAAPRDPLPPLDPREYETAGLPNSARPALDIQVVEQFAPVPELPALRFDSPTAADQEEDLLFSSGGNESFWGPSVAP